MISFRDSLSFIENLNGIIIGISRDSILSHKKFIKKYNLPFLLLSDPDSIACKEYDVLKEKNMYGKKAMAIERSTFIIDTSGSIKKVFRKIKVDGHAEDVIDALKELNT